MSSFKKIFPLITLFLKTSFWAAIPSQIFSSKCFCLCQFSATVMPITVQVFIFSLLLQLHKWKDCVQLSIMWWLLLQWWHMPAGPWDKCTCMSVSISENWGHFVIIFMNAGLFLLYPPLFLGLYILLSKCPSLAHLMYRNLSIMNLVMIS